MLKNIFLQIEFSRSLTSWIDFYKSPITSEYGVRNLARRQILDTIYNAVAYNPDAEHHLNDPDGVISIRVNQLMNGFNREVGLDVPLAANVFQCQHIFGLIT